MRKLCITIIVVSAIGLSACSHDNPLTQKQVKPQAAAEFLFAAAKSTGDGGARLYLKCMDSTDESHICDKLFTQMTQYKSKNSNIHKVTVSDVSDKNMWPAVRDYYTKDQYFDN